MQTQYKTDTNIHWYRRKFIILNANFITLNANFISLNAKSIILNAKSIILNAKLNIFQIPSGPALVCPSPTTCKIHHF